VGIVEAGLSSYISQTNETISKVGGGEQKLPTTTIEAVGVVTLALFFFYKSSHTDE